MSPNITRKQALTIARDATLDGRTRDAARVMAEFPRIWHAKPHDKDSGAIVVGESWSYTRQTTMINPTMRNQHKHCYVLWFGAYGWTRLHCYAMSLEDAIEDCAAWLADFAPGHIMAHGSDEHMELIKEQCDERGLAWPVPEDAWQRDNNPYDAAVNDAESDLTYTESGFLTSHEWGIALEDPTVEEFYAFICGE